MSKNKHFIKRAACVLLLCTLMLLCGCQLAHENEPAVDPDRLAGISVLLQTEKQFNTPLSGEYTDRTIPHEIDGEALYLEIGQTETGDPVRSINAGEWFTDLSQHFNTVDTEEEQSKSVLVEATMYICAEQLSSTPYLMLEEIYQREDGSLYAVDCGNNYAGHLDGLSITINESHTFSDSEGNSSLESMEVKLHVKGRLQADEVRVLAMRGMEIIEQFSAETTAELWLPAETEWVLIEEVLSDGSIQRAAYNQPLDQTNIRIYTVCEGGVFLPQVLTLRCPQPVR